MDHHIQTDKFSATLRRRGVDKKAKRLLITRFPNTQQSQDLSEPPNCAGFGRIRHFKRQDHRRWPDPLPIDPACRSLHQPPAQELRAQVFQNAICNWRCWYCYVDFELLAGNLRYSEWKSADQLVELYLDQENPPSVIDLSGGQPDLAPEWVIWMMKALTKRNLADRVYLWSDDNLSTDYLWRFLRPGQIQVLQSYVNYGRVACFKGFDPMSFSFNTRARPELYYRQFDLFRRLLELGIDLYAYATFTTPSLDDLSGKMKAFVDRLQSIHELLPLRTVPLRIEAFTPTAHRMESSHHRAIDEQERAYEFWQRELADRYSFTIRNLSITDIKIA